MYAVLWGDLLVEYREVLASNNTSRLVTLWKKGVSTSNNTSMLVTLWKKGSFQVIDIKYGEGFLALKGYRSGESIPMNLVNVYSSCNLPGKRLL